MSFKKVKILLGLGFFLSINLFHSMAWSANPYLGETIRISTRLHSFIGRPTWLLVIRDLDHGQTIPYLFDITKAQDYWLAFTYGRNYLILASTLKINTYGSNDNRYQQHTIHNFCGLESHGKILRHTSLSLSIIGDVTFNANTINCAVSRFIDAN